jgi:hypothetical protein
MLTAGHNISLHVGDVVYQPSPPPRPPLQRPLRAAHFTGRAGDLARLLADLQPGRVVTLCGPGGVGKTALAAEAVWTLAPSDDPPERFPDGVFFHSLYNQPQAALALEAIARAYGEDPHPTPAAAAQRALAGRCALLILDGAENADDLGAVLAVAGGCGVLVTTRRHGDAPADWPEEVAAAVEQALKAEDPRPPQGVRASDWERILTARRAEGDGLACLRRLGPEVQPGQTIAAMDDVEVRRPERKGKLSLRTARIATRTGFRYLSGYGETVLTQLYLLLLLCGGLHGWITLLGDGARWIRQFFTARLATFTHKELVLDWYHLVKKCYELASMLCRGRKAKAALMGCILPLLWRGQVDDVLVQLESYRPECRNPDRLDELINYLTARKPYIPNYKERRANRIYIGSGHAEKANDLIVSRRQKHQGMHWNEATADGLAALKTLVLNDAWDLYWLNRTVLPLAVPA